jgi:hypothetical protein
MRIAQFLSRKDYSYGGVIRTLALSLLAMLEGVIVYKYTNLLD